MTDAYKSIQAPSTGEFKDRGSKFLAFAWPVQSEADIQWHLDALRKEHFKARHHCYAWRLEPDGEHFRANDDGEPSSTAGRPILGQLDAFSLTYVLVVVVRYFGGTLLGTSGLINAYRAAAAEALNNAEIIACIVKDVFRIDFDYALMPDVMQAVKKLDLEIVHQQFDERGQMDVAIQQTEAPNALLRLRAQLWKVSEEEAETLGWPPGCTLKQLLP